MKDIKFLVFTVLSVFMFSTSAFAKKYDYKEYWQDSGWVKTDKTSSFKLLQKKNLVLPGVISASVTVTKNNKEKKEVVLSLLKKTLKISKWHHESSDQLDFYEAIHKQSGTLFMVSFNSKTNEFAMSSVKTRYLLPSYLEAYQWQVELLTQKKASSGKANALLQLFISEAQADIDTGFLSDKIGYYGDRILNKVGSSATSIGDKVTSATAAVNNVGDNVGKASASLDKASSSIDKFGDKITDAGDKLSDKLDKTLTAKNVAKLAGISGAVFGLTSTLSSMATHFILNNGYEVLRTFYYEAVGEFKPEEKERRLARFKDAMENFEKLSPKMNELQQKVSSVSLLMSYAASAPSEDLLAQLQADIEKQKEAESKDPNACAKCGTGQSLCIPQLEAMKQIIQQTGFKRSDVQTGGCGLLENLYSSWKAAEVNLSIVRQRVVQDMALFNASIIDSIQTDKAFQETRKQTNTCQSTASKKLSEFKSLLNGADCENDLSNLVCRQVEAYQQMKDSCADAANITLSKKDEADTAVAAAKFTGVMSQFSKKLVAMTCDPSKKDCKPGDLDKTRDEFNLNFGKTANSCKDSFFAKEYQSKSRSVASVEQNPTVAAKTESGWTLMGWFKSMFGSSKDNGKAAGQLAENVYQQSAG
ncbi:MAG: hypothetical protein H7256_04880 [Bdellovibrio sp.]|nr:hypothetical protein [Bdellovibrio sp.]